MAALGFSSELKNFGCARPVAVASCAGVVKAQVKTGSKDRKEGRRGREGGRKKKNRGN